MYILSIMHPTASLEVVTLANSGGRYIAGLLTLDYHELGIAFFKVMIDDYFGETPGNRVIALTKVVVIP